MIVIKTIKRFISKASLPHMIFYGPPGSGKTSTILACARELYGKNLNYMTFELNASDDRGISVVRNVIRDFASSKHIKQGYAIVILDEADSLTIDAQYALRSIMDQYISNTVFCLICNYISKIIKPIMSRCTHFHFSTVPLPYIKSYLQRIADKENIDITSDGLECLSKLSNGDMRKAINMMQSTNMAYHHVSCDTIMRCTGSPTTHDIHQLFNILTDDKTFRETYTHFVNYLQERNIIVDEIITGIFEHVMTSGYQLGDAVKWFEMMNNISSRWFQTHNTKVQVAALVALFKRSKRKANDHISNHYTPEPLQNYGLKRCRPESLDTLEPVKS